MLYDIFYHGSSMDSNCPLPPKPHKATRYAISTSVPHILRVPYRGAWIEAKLHRSDEGGFTVTVPSLPGCISEGEDIQHCAVNILAAIKLYKARP
jgi:hypothetical protein